MEKPGWRTPWGIPPFLVGCFRRTHAAIFSFRAGVNPRAMRMSVMPTTQTRLGRVIGGFRPCQERLHANGPAADHALAFEKTTQWGPAKTSP